MTVFLIPNHRKDIGYAVTCAAAAVLQESGVRVILPRPLRTDLPALAESCCFLAEDKAFSACDVVVTVGGDGTILHTGRRGLSYGKPLLGVNLGRMGFLATVEVDELDKLRRLASGDYTLDRRAILTVQVSGSKQFSQTALNDVVISKQTLGQTADIRIYCDDILVNHYLGDGVVIATPTGSTAYSLSAGGPILDARIAGIVMTPLCAHSMHTPPMVFSANRRLRVKAETPFHGSVRMSCDGRSEESISSQDTIEIALADQYISLVCFNEADQFEAIDTKLKGR